MLGARACAPLPAPGGGTPACDAMLGRGDGTLATDEATSQFLAVKITDVTKLPKATSRAASISFQEMP